jgi:hypothetical protein
MARKDAFRLALVLAALAWPSIELFSAEPAPSPQLAAAADFAPIAEVLRHPRCLNCHQPEVPLQGDEARLHVPRVLRGPDGLGVTAMRCTNCHLDHNNVAAAIPGAPHWSMPPASMDWTDLSDGELCRRLMDPLQNGGRTAEATLEHIAEDKLVLWGWDPGPGRDPVDMPHEEFVATFQRWLEAGALCPE